MKTLFERLDSKRYDTATKALNELMAKGELKEEEILKVMAIQNKSVIGDFLVDYQHFNQYNLAHMSIFINEHLDDKDRLFVSDLIEFASYWEIIIPYSKCFEFLSVYGKDDDYVVLATLDYIYENLKISYIKDIVKAFEGILYNPKHMQSSQIKAAFILFRITMKKIYLKDLTNLVAIGNSNKILLRNILGLDWNQKEYFDYAENLQAIMGDPLKN